MKRVEEDGRMKVDLLYGKGKLTIEAPEGAQVLHARPQPGLADERAAVMQGFRHPAGGRPLRELVSARDRVAIVISDITRPTPNHKLVPWLLEELPHADRDRIVVINGTGTHRDQTREEFIQMLGRDVVDTVSVINHHSRDMAELADLGESEFGCPILLNRAYVEADVRIVTGFIEPHFFAGFSGGPKGVMPAIAGLETIMAFHSPRMIGHPLSTWGVLQGNLLQRMAREVNALCPPDFLLNVTLNDDHAITGVFAGDLYEAHEKGCAFVREHAMIACERPYDVVVTTNSGYPLDQNLYQAVKGISAARQIVRRGGTIVCAAECADGVPDHGNFARLYREADGPADLLARIESGSVRMMDQWQAQRLAHIQEWADIFVYSLLPDHVVKSFAMNHVTDFPALWDALRARYGDGMTVAVMPSGPQTIPYVAEGTPIPAL
jgi:nickel-dependent lactate racemase